MTVDFVPCDWVKNLNIWGMKRGFNCKYSTFMTLPLFDVFLYLQREFDSCGTLNPCAILYLVALNI